MGHCSQEEILSLLYQVWFGPWSLAPGGHVAIIPGTVALLGLASSEERQAFHQKPRQRPGLAGKMALKPRVLSLQGSLAPLCLRPHPPWRESSQAQAH